MTRLWSSRTASMPRFVACGWRWEILPIHPCYIETLARRGYRWMLPVIEMESEPVAFADLRSSMGYPPGCRPDSRKPNRKEAFPLPRASVLAGAEWESYMPPKI